MLGIKPKSAERVARALTAQPSLQVQDTRFTNQNYHLRVFCPAFDAILDLLCQVVLLVCLFVTVYMVPWGAWEDSPILLLCDVWPGTSHTIVTAHVFIYTEVTLSKSGLSQ